MDHDDFDPTVPYWESDIDVAALYQAHLITDLTQDSLFDYLGLDETAETNGPVGFMRGRFSDALLPDHTFQWIFTPGAGEMPAIVVPVLVDGEMVDIMACGGFDHGWGCVTGHGNILGALTPGAPLRAYKSAQRWLMWADGVLPLRKRAWERLAEASLIIAEDPDHAGELAYRVFSLPACERSGGDYDTIIEAERIASTRVGVDTDRYDLRRFVVERAADRAVPNLKNEGILQ